MSDVPSIKPKKKNSEPAQDRGEVMETHNLQDIEKVRAELNLEKWSIWQPAKSKNSPKRKTLQREITLPDGNKITAKVEIGFTDRGVITTEDQKTFYAYIKLWENAGKPIGPVFFSDRKLAKTLNKKWGTNVIEFLENSSYKLRFNPFIWKNSYYDAETKETVKNIDTFTILSELKLIKREIDGHITKEAGYFRFNDFILKNLLANHTKPIYLDIILNFKSEIAQILYTHIDLIMADKTRYERRTEELFKDLNLEGKAYCKSSKRKQMLNPALKELIGVILSTGVITEAYLEKTKDEKDLKVVFKKQPFTKKIAEDRTEAGKYEEIKIPITLPKPNKEALELVKYFHEKLGRLNYQPSSKELDQATALIAECGFDLSKHVVSFAVKEAETTDFQMKTFGALFQYKFEALRSYEKQKRDLEIRQARELELKKQEKEEHRKAQSEREELDALFESLTEGEKESFQTLVDRRLLNHPWAKPDSALYQPTLQNIRYEALKEYRTNSGPLVPGSWQPQNQGTWPAASAGANNLPELTPHKTDPIPGSPGPETLLLLPERSQSLEQRDVRQGLS